MKINLRTGSLSPEGHVTLIYTLAKEMCNDLSLDPMWSTRIVTDHAQTLCAWITHTYKVKANFITMGDFCFVIDLEDGPELTALLLTHD